MLQCYDFKCSLKVWHLLIFFCVCRMWRGTSGIPEWIWLQKYSYNKTERWFGHNVESTCAGIAAEVRTVSSSFVWDCAGGKLKLNSVLVVTVAVLHGRGRWREYGYDGGRTGLNCSSEKIAHGCVRVLCKLQRGHCDRKLHGLDQWWANYGPRARYGPLKCSIRPARHYS